jgi:hypothetical protein
MAQMIENGHSSCYLSRNICQISISDSRQHTDRARLLPIFEKVEQ